MPELTRSNDDTLDDRVSPAPWETEADRAYGRLFDALGAQASDEELRLLRDLDEVVGERLTEAQDKALRIAEVILYGLDGEELVSLDVVPLGARREMELEGRVAALEAEMEATIKAGLREMLCQVAELQEMLSRRISLPALARRGPGD